MRNHQRGPIARYALKRILNFLLSMAVERGRRLIKHQNGRSLQNSARDGDTLLFPARQLEPAFPDFRFVAFRRNTDQRIDLREPRRFLHFGVCCLPAAISDVVADRVVEQHRVLRDHPDRLAQRFLCHRRDVLIVDQDASAGQIVEAE